VLWLAVASRAGQRDIYGDWKIDKDLTTDGSPAISAERASSLIGKELRLKAHAAIFDGDKSCSGSYEQEEIKSADQLTRYFRGIGPSEIKALDLEMPVAVYDIVCGQVFLKRPDEIIFYYAGFFLRAVRVKQTHAESRSQHGKN